MLRVTHRPLQHKKYRHQGDQGGSQEVGVRGCAHKNDATQPQDSEARSGQYSCHHQLPGGHNSAGTQSASFSEGEGGTQHRATGNGSGESVGGEHDSGVLPEGGADARCPQEGPLHCRERQHGGEGGCGTGGNPPVVGGADGSKGFFEEGGLLVENEEHNHHDDEHHKGAQPAGDRVPRLLNALEEPFDLGGGGNLGGLFAGAAGDAGSAICRGCRIHIERARGKGFRFPLGGDGKRVEDQRWRGRCSQRGCAPGTRTHVGGSTGRAAGCRVGCGWLRGGTRSAIRSSALSDSTASRSSARNNGVTDASVCR